MIDLKGLLEKYENDRLAAYADVSNRLLEEDPDETLLTVKHKLERCIAEEMMDEYGWERTDAGKWRKVESDEFFAQLRTARNAD